MFKSHPASPIYHSAQVRINQLASISGLISTRETEKFTPRHPLQTKTKFGPRLVRNSSGKSRLIYAWIRLYRYSSSEHLASLMSAASALICMHTFWQPSLPNGIVRIEGP